jgi:hypothetical protein
VRAALRTFAILMLVGSSVSPAGAWDLRDQIPAVTGKLGIKSLGAFEALADAISDTAARDVPVLAASAGFTYRYNPELGIFERTSETLGPLFVERPDTLGRGKINTSVSFQYVQFDQWDGQDLGGLTAPAPIIARETDANGNLLRRSAWEYRYNLGLINHIVGLSLTYGLFDDLDVNLTVPLMSTHFDTTATVHQVAVAEPGQPFTAQPGATASSRLEATKYGVGDILLRGKYQLPQAGGLRSAAGLQFRLPSGDQNNFQGTGALEVTPSLYASTVLWSRVEPHVGVGVDLCADDVSRSEGRYGGGVDVNITDRIGVVLDFLGRSEFKRSSPPGATEFKHLVAGKSTPWPILNARFDRKDFFDFSFGIRGVIWRTIMFFVNGIYAVNDDGLRSSEIIPTVGFEATF